MNKDYLIKEINRRLTELKQERISIISGKKDLSIRSKSTMLSNITKETGILNFMLDLLCNVPDSYSINDLNLIAAFDSIVCKRSYDMSDRAIAVRRNRRKSD